MSGKQRVSKISKPSVLRYSKERVSHRTVRAHYLRWRREQNPPIPERCDNSQCRYFTEDLEWNGKPLPLILDHQNGVNGDNRPTNLRLLCPNCDSQLPTRGGGNKGKTRKSDGGFAIVDSTGKWHYTLPAEAGVLQLTFGGGDMQVDKSSSLTKDDERK